MTDSLVIKNFLRKVITVLPKIRFNFSVKVNGILSMEIFGAEKEPTLNLSNGIALVVNCQHYLSTPKFDTTELPCSRIHPVLGHPVMLFIPDDVVGMGLLGELTLTPAVALCPCPKVFSNQLNRISSVSISTQPSRSAAGCSPKRDESACPHRSVCTSVYGTSTISRTSNFLSSCSQRKMRQSRTQTRHMRTAAWNSLQGPASKQKTRGLREAAKAWRRRGPSALLGP